VLTLTENAGFSPAFIYERRSLSSKKELEFDFIFRLQSKNAFDFVSQRASGTT
jgi:hypothetical protein